MVYEVFEQPAAAEALDRLADDPELAYVLDAIERTIERLAEVPFDRRLGTMAFRSEVLGNLSATPARADDWYLIWRRGDEARSIALVLVTRLDVGKPG